MTVSYWKLNRIIPPLWLLLLIEEEKLSTPSMGPCTIYLIIKFLIVASFLPFKLIIWVRIYFEISLFLRVWMQSGYYNHIEPISFRLKRSYPSSFIDSARHQVCHQRENKVWIAGGNKGCMVLLYSSSYWDSSSENSLCATSCVCCSKNTCELDGVICWHYWACAGARLWVCEMKALPQWHLRGVDMKFTYLTKANSHRR